MKLKLLKTCILILAMLVFLCGCSSNNSNTYNNIDDNTSLSQEMSPLDNFISNYNSCYENKIDNYSYVDIQNEEYYRTEFRLNAFKNAKSIFLTINKSKILIIDYSSNLKNNIRFYITNGDFRKNASEILKVLDTDITNEEIENSFNSLSNSFYIGNNITGTILKDEIMIDYTF